MMEAHAATLEAREAEANQLTAELETRNTEAFQMAAELDGLQSALGQATLERQESSRMHEASLKQNEETMAAEMELVEAAAKEEVRARRESMQAKKDLEIDELKAQLVAKDEKLQSLKIKTALETGKSVVPPGMKLDKDRKVLAVTR
mmetsp:Transcript_74971/g.213239  ORF Transcript_74971/g.213239 Transcript_74971/m.213239 type:complete len:147 (-) Transcript_74971:206-646(-)